MRLPSLTHVLLQVLDVGIALNEPQQFVDDRFQVQLLGGHHREAFGQVKAHLPAEDRARAGAGAVGFVVPVLQNVAHEVKVGLHRVGYPEQSVNDLFYMPDHVVAWP